MCVMPATSYSYKRVYLIAKKFNTSEGVRPLATCAGSLLDHKWKKKLTQAGKSSINVDIDKSIF